MLDEKTMQERRRGIKFAMDKIEGNAKDDRLRNRRGWLFLEAYCEALQFVLEDKV